MYTPDEQMAPYLQLKETYFEEMTLDGIIPEMDNSSSLSPTRAIEIGYLGPKSNIMPVHGACDIFYCKNVSEKTM